MKFAIHAILWSIGPCFAAITGTLVDFGNKPLAACDVKMGAHAVKSDAAGAFALSTVSLKDGGAKPALRILDQDGLEVFNLRGSRVQAFEQGPAHYIFRSPSGNADLQAIALRKSAAAESLQVKCTGFVLMKVPVTGPDQALGTLKVLVPEVIAGAHVDYNPYANQSPNWYKVITHSHTIAHESEKQTTPTKIANAYKALGIHAVALTDHDKLTTFTGVAGILYILGEEVTTNDGDMNVFGINKVIAANMTGQRVIDAAIAAGNGFTQVNHPLDSDANDAGRLTTYLNGLKNLWGIEVYNGGRLSQDATAAWDNLISQKKRVWATAGDDAHSILVIDDGAGVPETGRMWAVVQSPELTVDALMANMRAGNFYASEGPDMRISVNGDVVSVSSASGNSLTWFTTARKQVKKVTLGAAADTYTLTGSETFIRVMVTDSKGKRAISQPIFSK